MAHLNFEFKARTNRLNEIENKLLQLNPVFIGEDKQTDTYFNVAKGRLKLREGNIENSLIYYERSDVAEAKRSEVILYKHAPDKDLKDILITVHGIKVVVKKSRKIYFIDNVKFHFDHVDGLGSFVEVEAIDHSGDIGIQKLTEQCNQFSELFEIKNSDFISLSYSDLILSNK